MRKVVTGLVLGTVLLVQTGCFDVVVEESADEWACASCDVWYDPLWSWLAPDYGWEYHEDEWIEEVWVDEWYWFEDEEWYYDEYYDEWYCEECDEWYYEEEWIDDWEDDSDWEDEEWYDHWDYWF
ncbi:MAG: hypothetical protein KKI02_09180 [Planctomycetes bacterium]|nr:hypothetical protein [Planctomycetota bacterium]